MIEVYIDGASAGDPGLSGAGVYVKIGDGTTQSYHFPLGMMSNHEAEFLALIRGLELCVENNWRIVSFRTDSQAVESAVEKRYAKDKRYTVLLEQALTFADQLDLFFIKWIPSKQNKVADELARKAIQLNRKTK
ncbi:reverse transcriptase-like protein [Fictibacillus phosphorivorans]|uniref:reverse transcriptase-like protein n=1 Tax=Fictibacillus phosphorivorans TaxID=1221500 RepID=UPI00204002D4|nr:reverse transcriptase-like protein [Fictibacillus phosphorivorans]MCM3719626.1 reverse transcriptase-like protein [Fictibacillus phosphorivorans]MCM3777300.1 reverse transcriptase-like protein [Fictibacillus phosphorivorans]